MPWNRIDGVNGDVEKEVHDVVDVTVRWFKSTSEIKSDTFVV